MTEGIDITINLKDVMPPVSITSTVSWFDVNYSLIFSLCLKRLLIKFDLKDL